MLYSCLRQNEMERALFWVDDALYDVLGEGNSQRLAFTLAAIGAIFDIHAHFGNCMHRR